MRMLSQQALIDAAMALDCVVQIDALAKEGDQAEALANLSVLAAATASYLPVIRGVIATQAKAAEAMDLNPIPQVRVIASIGLADPHPHPANSQDRPSG